MGSVDLDKCYEVVLKLTNEGGKIIKERIWSKKSVEYKTCEIDLVTETDKEVEKLLISGLESNFPDHKFIGEESSEEDKKKCELTDAPTWIIDPVDGTMNFVHGYPNVCVSIALWVKKTPEIGIIYNPILELMFTARKGQGAFLNGNKIGVSTETDVAKALLAFELGTSRDSDRLEVVLKNLQTLIPKVHGIRSSGSCALNMALVALGGADASFEFGIHAWDMAAGDLIVREAGGVCMDPTGGPLDVMSRRYMCASTQTLADGLIKIITQHYPERDN